MCLKPYSICFQKGKKKNVSKQRANTAPWNSCVSYITVMCECVYQVTSANYSVDCANRSILLQPLMDPYLEPFQTLKQSYQKLWKFFSNIHLKWIQELLEKISHESYWILYKRLNVANYFRNFLIYATCALS